MSANWQKYPESTPQPQCVTIRGYAEGANGSDLDVQEGTGITSIVRTGEGLYTVTFDRGFKKLVSWNFGFGADAAADVKGHTCVIDVDSLVLTPPAATLDIAITNASETLDDLLVNEFLSFEFTFAQTELDK